MQGQQHSARTLDHRSVQPGSHWDLLGHSGSELQPPFGQQHRKKKLLSSMDAGIVDQIMHLNNSCKKYSECIYSGFW